MTTEHGRVLAVNRVRLGSELVGAHAAGVSTLLIEDGADFDEDGGSLLVGAQVVTYSSATHIEADDTASLTLSAMLTTAADDGDPVLLYDASRASTATEVYAEVELDGEAGGDTFRALVAHHLIDALPEGIRGLVGESVLMTEDGDDWRVVDVLGLSADASGPKWEDDDPHTLTAAEVTAGTFTHTLLHSRVVDHHEFLALVNGVALGPDRFTLDADTGKATVTLGGWETVADNFRFHYAYLRGPVAEVVILDIPAPFYSEHAGSNSLSIPVPTGAEVGGLVVVTASGDGGTISASTDPRLTLVYDATDWKVWAGHLVTGGGKAWNDPFLITRVGGFSAACGNLVCYPPGVDVGRTGFVTSPADDKSENVPLLSNATSVCVVARAKDGGIAGSTFSQTGGAVYDHRGTVAYASSRTGLFHWSSGGVPAGSNPAKEFTTNGVGGTLALATLELVGV